ncbi:hypothetical protein D3C85_753560 [compost metagenome]
MLGRHDLRDHPAHRSADDMRTFDPKRVQQPDSIIGHIAEGVGQVEPLASPQGLRQGGHFDDGRLVEMGGEADVPIVKADDPIA